MMHNSTSRDEQLVAILPSPNGYKQGWREGRKATTASLHSGSVLPGFSPVQH